MKFTEALQKLSENPDKGYIINKFYNYTVKFCKSTLHIVNNNWESKDIFYVEISDFNCEWEYHE